jgi:acyl dehydratase
MLKSGNLEFRPGDRIGLSGWKQVTQDRIDRFAEATDDFQFVHVDAARAAAETPFGGTIAHGFLTLSLVSVLAEDLFPAASEPRTVILVAVDRVKFISPVRAGERVRGDFVLDKMVWLQETKAIVKIRVAVEIEHQKELALTCDVSWLFMYEDSGGDPALASAGRLADLDRA